MSSTVSIRHWSRLLQLLDNEVYGTVSRLPAVTVVATEQSSCLIEN
jgi:hypothetical protein